VLPELFKEGSYPGADPKSSFADASVPTATRWEVEGWERQNDMVLALTPAETWLPLPNC